LNELKTLIKYFKLDWNDMLTMYDIYKLSSFGPNEEILTNDAE